MVSGFGHPRKVTEGQSKRAASHAAAGGNARSQFPKQLRTNNSGTQQNQHPVMHKPPTVAPYPPTYAEFERLVDSRRTILGEVGMWISVGMWP